MQRLRFLNFKNNYYLLKYYSTFKRVYLFVLLRLVFHIVIVHLKCLSEKGLAKKSDIDIWQTHLLRVSPSHFLIN